MERALWLAMEDCKMSLTTPFVLELEWFTEKVLWQYISLIIKGTSRYTGAYIERNLQVFETITSPYPIYTYLSTCWFFK